MPTLASSATLLAVLVGALALWGLLRLRDGRFRAAAPAGSAGDLTALLPGPLGRRATFVQLSSPACATCPQVSRALRGVADGTDVVHVEVDATQRPDVVRLVGALRTPTVLLLDAAGSVRVRTSGPVTATQARAALEGVLR